MKNNYKPVVFIVLLVFCGLIIHETIAYYSSSDTFTNNFNTSNYEVEAQEIFESPDKWLPGETIPKTVIATNKGETPIAVRIKLTPRWVDENNNSLPLKDNNNNDVAVINFNSNLNSKWIYQDGYYYYRKSLNQNESTPTLMESVTFNPIADITNVKNCETVNGVTSCITSFSGYSGGKYTLQVDIETSQYDQYKNIWDTDVEIKEQRKIDGMLKKETCTNLYCKPFGKGNVNKVSYESITIVDNTNVPNNALASYDVSEEQNGSVKFWYLDADGNGRYEMYIGQDGGVIANYDSSYALAGYSNVKEMNLSKLDTSYVTDMSYMFSNISDSELVLNLRINGLETWDTGNVTNMSNMFSFILYYDTSTPPSSTLLISGLNNWDTSNVTDMSDMFFETGYTSTTWNIGDLSNWNVSKVENMSKMFYNAARRSSVFTIGDISNWNTGNLKDISHMFDTTGRQATTWNIGDLSNWNTSNVTNMEGTFQDSGYNALSFSLDLSNWDTGNVTNMSYIFTNSGRNATTWSVGNLSNWNTSKVTNMLGLFALAGYQSSTWNIGDLSNWDTSHVTNMHSMFRSAGYSATTWNSIGTLKVYADNITQIFDGTMNAKATINIYSNPSIYDGAFDNASVKQGSGITVNYSSNTSNIDRIIATKSGNSNVAKGSLLD